MTIQPRDEVLGSIKPLIRSANIEVIPLKGAEEKLTALPVSTTVTITCSPKFGLDRTLAHVEAARRRGSHVVPHLAARMVASEAELRRFVTRLAEMGIDDLYVIGGDGAEPVGPYAEASDILEALQGLDHTFARLGVGCYPEGHPHIDDDALVDALVRKQEYADYMVSQLCFDSTALLNWLRTARAAGITLPIRIGLAAPMQARKLVELSLKIGVGSSVKFLTKQHGIVGNLLLGRSYAPEELLLDLVAEPDFDELNIEGVHLFSFNQIEATTAWLARNG
ncbi:methylenetetrahydrofolate reductase [Mycobacterium sp. BMJ-28]